MSFFHTEHFTCELIVKRHSHVVWAVITSVTITNTSHTYWQNAERLYLTHSNLIVNKMWVLGSLPIVINCAKFHLYCTSSFWVLPLTSEVTFTTDRTELCCDLYVVLNLLLLVSLCLGFLCIFCCLLYICLSVAVQLIAWKVPPLHWAGMCQIEVVGYW